MTADRPEVDSTKQFVTTVPDDVGCLDINGLGGGLKFVNERKMAFTHTAAVALLEMPEFPGDRPLRPEHVIYLIGTMRRKTFHWEWCKLITCTCKQPAFNQPANAEFRMNGQHTAWARLEMPADETAHVSIMRYEAATVEDMRTLYASIDRNASRTKANVINSHLVGCNEFAEFPANLIRHTAEGLAVWKWQAATERSTHDGDDIACLMKTKHLEVCQRVMRFLNTQGLNIRHRDCSHIRRSPVMAAMIATFDKVPTIAPEFWLPVKDGVNLERTDDPRHKLRSELRASVVSMCGGKKAKRVSVEEMYRWCLYAWNAHREGRTLSSLRVQIEAPRPGLK